jgi:3-hydroxyisobutyrate dehydrogenase-like beta-hydroxyacid dehydrogenase
MLKDVNLMMAEGKRTQLDTSGLSGVKKLLETTIAQGNGQ